MKVRMLVSLSGPNGTFEPGDIYEAPEDEARRLVYARYALPFTETRVEHAVKKAVRETRKK